jgi:ParB family chromosome partitioning protein
MQNYLDLHRHAAVRVRLLDQPGVALRLMVAHAIAGSELWQVRAEPQAAKNEAIAASVQDCAAEGIFRTRRTEVLALLGFEADGGCVAGSNGDDYALVAVFTRLLALDDEAVLRILALVMAETLEAGTAAVEAVGNHLKVDLRGLWQADETFFELVRDRPAVNALLANVAGKAVADGNIADKTKAQKQIIRDCLAGANGRARVENWLPGWLEFPVQTITARGSLNTVEDWNRVKELLP